MPERAVAAGMVPSVKMFPNSSLSNSPFRNWDQMSRFLFELGGKWIILPSLVFKTALMFTVIILIKSAPSTATQNEIACVFGEGPGKLSSGMVVAKKEKKKKNQKIKKFKKIIKNYKKHMASEYLSIRL